MAQRTKTVNYSGQAYDSPFISAPMLPLQAHIDLTTLQGTDYVDEDGILKPGTPLRYDSSTKKYSPVDAASQVAFGVVANPEHCANGSENADLQGDVMVTTFATGTVNRTVAEDQLGRAYNANEVEAINASKSIHLV